MKRSTLISACLLIFILNLTSQVGVGTTAPVAPLDILGVGTSPSIPGSTSTGILRIGNSTLEAVDIGKMIGSPFAAWVQAGYNGIATDPLSLQPVGGNVGIGTTDPIEKLDVNGKIKIGNNASSSVAGTIRWNDETNDFEGFNGTVWLSLTQSNYDGWPDDNNGVGQIADYMETTSNDGGPSNYFGLAVSISGDYAIIGASFDDIGPNTDQGSAYIFIKSGTEWIQQAKLVAADGAASDRFGGSVAISGDYVIVGASNDDIGAHLDQGSAYIFIRSGDLWTQQAKLVATTGNDYDGFASSVDIDNEYAIAGEPADDIGSITNQGAAHIFLRSGSTWSLQQKLTAIDGTYFDYFGADVSIDNTTVLVGAELDDTGSNSEQGSAYVYTRSGSTWTQQTKLLAVDGDDQDRFGGNVSLEGDYAVVGAALSGEPIDGKGSAYIFHRTGITWAQQAKLMAPIGTGLEYFGVSVCMSGEKIIIGASEDESYPDCAGPVRIGISYIYQKQNNIWTLYSTVEDPLGEDGEGFGYSVSLSGDFFIVGAPYASPNGVNQKGKVIFGRID